MEQHPIERTPIRWTLENRLKLFLAILQTAEVRVDNSKVADLLGGTSRGIAQQVILLRNMSKTVFSADDPSTAFNEALSSKGRKTSATTSGGGGENVKSKGDTKPHDFPKVTTPPATPDVIKTEPCAVSPTKSRKTATGPRTPGPKTTPSKRAQGTDRVLSGRVAKPATKSTPKRTPVSTAYPDIEDPLLEFSEEFDQVTRERGQSGVEMTI